MTYSAAWKGLQRCFKTGLRKRALEVLAEPGLVWAMMVLSQSYESRVWVGHHAANMIGRIGDGRYKATLGMPQPRRNAASAKCESRMAAKSADHLFTVDSILRPQQMTGNPAARAASSCSGQCPVRAGRAYRGDAATISLQQALAYRCLIFQVRERLFVALKLTPGNLGDRRPDPCFKGARRAK